MITNSTADKDKGNTNDRSRRFCQTERLPLTKFLAYNDGTFWVANDDEVTDDGSRRRVLEEEESHFGAKMDTLSFFGHDRVISISDQEQGAVSRRALQEAIGNDTIARIVYGRQCTCARGVGDYYCPVEAELCRVWQYGGFYRRSSRIIQCEGEILDYHLRLSLPVMVLGYLFLLFYLLGSRKGRNATTYMRKLCCCWSDERYEHALWEEIQERYRRTHRTSVNNAPVGAVTAKVPACLKTKRYDGNTTQQQDCMICLAEFQKGDRVGDLACGHIFHADPCLKEWISRRNHCPLCHEENLAQPTKVPQPTIEPSQQGTMLISTSH